MLTIVDEYSRFPFAFPTKNMDSNTVIECLHSLFSLFGAPAYVHSDRGQSFMSHGLRQYLHGNGIATSHTTPYNPTGNGQVERYNAIVWKTILLALKSQNMDVKSWENVLPSALHSIRSLLSTATNTTPHERFLNHPRRSMYGASMPSWLANGNSKVLLKRHVRSSKYDPLVDEVELLEANHQYAHIRYPDGRESTVSTQHLAPAGESSCDQSESAPYHTTTTDPEGLHTQSEDYPAGAEMERDLKVHTHSPVGTTEHLNGSSEASNASENMDTPVPELRRSQRQRRAPDRYGY